ncbi:hypothetical protein F2P81_001080 [Scophthalmus maximus]|uniref:Uncharacterized protein n=1 Tax=Scophthalmus maximus TaxID=52904 RepID=A0A6A4TKR5_SCOMX|nr:hypothetical protein F2P81_001080 [Scophthalmus maximus]
MTAALRTLITNINAKTEQHLTADPGTEVDADVFEELLRAGNLTIKVSTERSTGPVKIGIARSTGIASTAVGLPPVFPACFVTRAHMRKFGDVVDLSDLLSEYYKYNKDIVNEVGTTALDDQLFSIVEGVGFRSLMEYMEPRYILPRRRHFADVCRPEMYKVVATHIHELLARDIPTMSFTTEFRC